jgi:ATP-dependent Clp protease adaptor protein ClpS
MPSWYLWDITINFIFAIMDILESPEVEEDVEEKLSHKIVIYNDDVNTFEHVIECLQKYCSHKMIQAEQCAHIIHFNGKCDVKNGDFEDLVVIKQTLNEKGLTAKIE